MTEEDYDAKAEAEETDYNIQLIEEEVTEWKEKAKAYKKVLLILKKWTLDPVAHNMIVKVLKDN